MTLVDLCHAWCLVPLRAWLLPCASRPWHWLSSPPVCGWELEEGEAPLLSSCALGRQVEQLQGRAQLLVDGELLLHIDATDAIRKHGDDGLVRHL